MTTVVTTSGRFVTYGPVRGSGGVSHRSLEAAAYALRKDQRACKARGGYSDRQVYELDIKGNRHAISLDDQDQVDAICRD